jgi:hypothetical protein
MRIATEPTLRAAEPPSSVSRCSAAAWRKLHLRGLSPRSRRQQSAGFGVSEHFAPKENVMKVRVIFEFELLQSDADPDLIEDATIDHFEEVAQAIVAVIEERVITPGFLPVDQMNAGVIMGAWSCETELVIGSVRGE